MKDFKFLTEQFLYAFKRELQAAYHDFSFDVESDWICFECYPKWDNALLNVFNNFDLKEEKEYYISLSKEDKQYINSYIIDEGIYINMITPIWME